VVFLGDVGVGKMNLFSRLITDHTPDSPHPTVNGQNFPVTLIDTSDQERFRAFASVFFRDDYLAVIVYSISQCWSIESIIF
jgi:GTPase SAR1 family protein